MSNIALGILIQAQDLASGALKGIGGEADKTAHKLTGLGAALGNAGKGMQSFGSSLSAAGTKLTVFTGVVAGAGVGLLEMALDVQASERQVNMSMGNMADAALKWSADMSDAYGMDDEEIANLVSKTDLLMQSMGHGEQAAFDYSKSLTTLSYSYSRMLAGGKSAAEIQEILNTAMTGRTTGLRELGLVIKEDEIAEYALTQGWIKQGQTLSDAGKAAAVYNLIMEKSTVAQGALGTTLDENSTKLERAQTEFGNLGENVGQALWGPAGDALTWLNDVGLPTLSENIGRLNYEWDEMGETGQRRVLTVAALFLANGPLMKAMGVTIQGVGLMINAFGLLPGKVRGAVLASIPFLGLLYEGAKLVNSIVTGTMQTAGDFLKDKPGFEDMSANYLGNAAQSRQAFGDAEKFFQGIGAGIGGAVSDGIGNGTGALLDEMYNLGGDAADALGLGMVSNAPKGFAWVWDEEQGTSVLKQVAAVGNEFKKMAKPDGAAAAGDSGSKAGKAIADAMTKAESAVKSLIGSFKSLRNETDPKDENLARLEAGMADPSGPWGKMIPDSVAMMSAEDKQKWLEGRRAASEKGMKERGQAGSAVEGVVAAMAAAGITRQPTQDEVTQLLAAAGITLPPEAIAGALQQQIADASHDVSVSGMFGKLFGVETGKGGASDVLSGLVGGGAGMAGATGAGGSDMAPQGKALATGFANAFLGPMNMLWGAVTAGFQEMFDNIGTAIAEAVAAYNASPAGQAKPMTAIAMPQLKAFTPIPSFATGGYTGNYEGPAYLHKRETIRNEQQEKALGKFNGARFYVYANDAAGGHAAAKAIRSDLDIINDGMGDKVQKRKAMGRPGLSY